jgi:uncharacterized protein (DUF1697 family)
MPTTYIALLRGINVGGKNKLLMKDLIEIFAQTGCVGVRNYIQSGNIIFQASPTLAKRIPALISTGIEERFGFRTTLVIRTHQQLRQAAMQNPYQGKSDHAVFGAVMFLANAPQAEDLNKLDPLRSPPDEYSVLGDTIYLHAATGLAKTKLTNAYFDSKLKTVSTVRNWRTVFKLLEMMES